MSFDELSSEWDTPRRIDRAKVLADSIMNSLENTKILSALEIGSGTGLIAFELIDKFCEIYCVDSSKEMISVLKRKVMYCDIQNVFAFGTELLSDSKYYEKFGVIYSSMVFHHIIDIEEELNALHKLMKKDGTLIIVDLDKDDGGLHKEEANFSGHNGFDRFELQKAVEKSGFRNVNFQTVYLGTKKIDNDVINYSLFLCSANSST